MTREEKLIASISRDTLMRLEFQKIWMAKCQVEKNNKPIVPIQTVSRKTYTPNYQRGGTDDYRRSY